MHILLVEDNYALRRLYGRELQKAGFEITEANDLKAAWKLLHWGQFDAAVCDIELSDGNTFALMPELVDRGVPVIAISSDNNYEDECRWMGVSAFMMKPFPLRDLVNAVYALDDQLAV